MRGHTQRLLFFNLVQLYCIPYLYNLQINSWSNLSTMFRIKIQKSFFYISSLKETENIYWMINNSLLHENYYWYALLGVYKVRLSSHSHKPWARTSWCSLFTAVGIWIHHLEKNCKSYPIAATNHDCFAKS